MSNKLDRLTSVIQQVEDSVNQIEALIEEAFADKDFEFIETFRDKRNCTLPESMPILTMLVRKAQDKVNELDNVAFVLQLEKGKSNIGWRELAKSGQRVKAIAELIDWVGSHSFKIAEGRSVVDAYLKHNF